MSLKDFPRNRDATNSTSERAEVRALVATLKQCIRSRDLKRGKEAHAKAVQSGLSSNAYVLTSLINMYTRCGHTSEARKVFDQLGHRDVVSWTCLISGYLDNGESELALEVFDESERSRCQPDPRLYVAALSACASLALKQRESSREWLGKGERVYNQAVKSRCSNVFVENTLIDMYAKGGDMEKSRRVFDSMSERNSVSWSTVLQGYVNNKENKEALRLFEGMEESVADARVYVAALSACSGLAAEHREQKLGVGLLERYLEQGRRIYSQAARNKACDTFVENAAIDVFSRCGCMELARRVFDGMSRRDVVSWTSLLQGYVENGESELALELFDGMKRVSVPRGCTAPNSRTFVVALTACASLGARHRGEGDGEVSRWLAKGREIHAEAVTCRCSNIFVENSLLSMYSDCGDVSSAKTVFDGMVRRDVVSWNALMTGYVNNGENECAVELIQMMSRTGVDRNSLTYVAALTACGNLMAVESGERLHGEIRRRGLERELVVANSLVDFYSKCGSMEAAKLVFDSIGNKSIVSWTALMCGYGLQGDTTRVFELFERMREQGVKPDGVCFVCLLTACSHAGMTERGKEYFESMRSVYGVTPTVKHYACMVDLFGRANRVEEAWRVVRSMPCRADVVTWTAMLASCSRSGNVALGQLAYESLMEVDERIGNVYKSGNCKRRGQTCWIDQMDKVYRFYN